MRGLELPESLHTLVLSRIDELSESPRRTVKVASVVGRVFEAPTLAGRTRISASCPTSSTISTRCAPPTSSGSIGSSSRRTSSSTSPPRRWRTRACRSPSGADLHTRIGTYLETSDPDGIDAQIDILAHHFWHGDDVEKKRTYLARAADAARASYANAAAVDYLSAPRSAALRRRTRRGAPEARQVAGIHRRLADGREDDARGAGACRRARGRCIARLGGSRPRRGPPASRAATTRRPSISRRRARHFDTAGLDEGVGQVLHLAGHRGRAARRVRRGASSATESLAIRERLGDTAALGGLYSNLGDRRRIRGRHGDRARRTTSARWALRHEVGDRWAIGVSENNLGMIALHESEFDAARDHFETSMRLNREIGDAWMVAIGAQQPRQRDARPRRSRGGAASTMPRRWRRIATTTIAGRWRSCSRTWGSSRPARGCDGRARGPRRGAEDARRDRRATRAGARGGARHGPRRCARRTRRGGRGSGGRARARDGARPGRGARPEDLRGA